MVKWALRCVKKRYFGKSGDDVNLCKRQGGGIVLLGLKSYLVLGKLHSMTFRVVVSHRVQVEEKL